MKSVESFDIRIAKVSKIHSYSNRIRLSLQSIGTSLIFIALFISFIIGVGPYVLICNTAFDIAVLVTLRPAIRKAVRLSDRAKRTLQKLEFEKMMYQKRLKKEMLT